MNSGDVIDNRGDIYGDGVNVSARLESLADPGGICVSESVRTAIGKKLGPAFRFRRKQEVKNIRRHPVVVCLLNTNTFGRLNLKLKGACSSVDFVQIL